MQKCISFNLTENICLQFLPAWRLIRAGSRLGGRRASGDKRAWTAAHAVLVLGLVNSFVIIGRLSGLLNVYSST